MAEFVTLTCPSCGGKLQITSDIEQFVCGHCGNEHIVKRGGGIIAIAPIIEGIKKVQTGTDKTASELAIKRLKEELKVLGLDTKKLLHTVKRQWGEAHGFLDMKPTNRMFDRLRVINDYLFEKGIISKKQRRIPEFLIQWDNIEILYSLSIVDFEKIKLRAQELCDKSKAEKRKAYEELIEWCDKVKSLLQTIQDKSSELKLHEQRVKM
jgi:hypothetical protein